MSDTVEKKDWIKEMIEREAIPKVMREETIEQFSERHDIYPSNYNYQRTKKENQQKIVKLCLSIAKEKLPEVLKTLGEQAEKGKERSIEMFLKFIVELSEKTDITSGGKPIPMMDLTLIKRDEDKGTNKEI